jgi:hypothetical protein
LKYQGGGPLFPRTLDSDRSIVELD